MSKDCANPICHRQAYYTTHCEACWLQEIQRLQEALEREFGLTADDLAALSKGVSDEPT